MKRLTFKIISDYRTIIMGIAILSIIIFHFTEDCMLYNYHYDGFIKLYKTFISSGGVDIFLLVSGLGLYYSMKKTKSIKSFYKKRYFRVLIPYLIVSIPAFIWFSIHNNLGILDFIKNITFINIFVEGNYWYWYVFFICFLYLLFPIIYKFINDKYVFIKVVFLCFVSTLISIIIYLVDINLFYKLELMLLRFVPFFVGILLGYYSYHKKKITKVELVIILCLLLSFLLVLLHNIFLKRYGIFLGLSSLILIIIMLLDKIDKTKFYNIFSKIFTFLGKYSLELYLLTVTFRKIFKNYGLMTCKIEYFILYIFISFIFVFIVNYFTKIINNRLRI